MRIVKLLLLVVIFVSATSFTPHEELTWTAIGDSITYLNDHADETGNRITKGYLAGVTEKLPYIKYTNQGHNGWTATRIAKDTEQLGLQKSDVYTVFLGTNDWWHSGNLGTVNDYRDNTGYATVYGAFRVIINKLRNLNPDAHIVLITPMQRGDFVYINNPKNNAWGSYKPKDGRTLEEFANAVKEIGQLENMPVVDLYHKGSLSVKNAVNFKRVRNPRTKQYENYTYPAYTAVGFHPETDEYPYPPEAINITYDGLHPSDKGHKIIAGMLVKVMKKF
jgi:lysophospholipase L1-like esterase